MTDPEDEDAGLLEGAEEYEIHPDMIWGTWVNDDNFRVYINAEQTLTFSREAAIALHTALGMGLRCSLRSTLAPFWRRFSHWFSFVK